MTNVAKIKSKMAVWRPFLIVFSSLNRKSCMIAKTVIQNKMSGVTQVKHRTILANI